MYKELQQTPRESDRYTTLKTNLSTYNKIIKKNIREAKMLYYTESFDIQKHDIKRPGNWSPKLSVKRVTRDRRLTKF